MPKKKPGMTPEEQIKEFEKAARKLIDAGELNPTDAEHIVENVLKSGAARRRVT
jgi:hypothetical protein